MESIRSVDILANHGCHLQKPSLLDPRGLIAGSWTFAPSKKVFPVYEPSTGQLLHECSDFGRESFVEAIDCAYDGYQAFHKDTTAKERGAMLRRWHDLILANDEDLAKIISPENGKILAEAQGEVRYAVSFVAWFAEEATRSYGDLIPSSYHNSTVMVSKEPIGVCSIITPWNFSAAMITRKIAPALAAGCSVVIKPPSETPFSAIALAKLALEASIPSSCIHVVSTKDRSASLELATNSKVKKLSFTGSTDVGKMLTKFAADTMKKLSMELGGNAPFIVFSDANLDLAVDGAMISKFRSSGQTCVCTNRFLVHHSVVDEFTEKLVRKVECLELGKGIDNGVTQGPLVNSAAVTKVAAHIEDALSKGAVLKTGGKTPKNFKGFFYEPTVITNATTEMHVASQETFGPLAAIFTFDTEEDAVQIPNDTEFGLAGYFFSKDIGRVMPVAQRLECGMVGVNTGLISAAESPFGGIKENGVGREGSKYGMAEYQNLKTVTISNIHL